MTTTFSEVMKGALALEGALSVNIPEDWLQGRSVYGGLQAALALRAMRSLVPSRPIRSLQVTCTAPLSGDVRAEASVLRTGKNTTQVEARLYGPDGVTTQIIGLFGAARESQIRVEMQQPELTGDQSITFPFIAGLTPSFTQHFVARLRRGGIPFSGEETRESTYELDLKDSGDVNEETIVALADFVPPVGLSTLRAPAFSSTLTWFLEFLVEPPTDAPLENWRLDSELVAAADGYNQQASVLWAPDGTAVALSRQTMLVFG